MRDEDGSGPPGDGTADGPAPRTVLVTGQGGAGRTTVAAATALAAAREGRRTLLLSAEAPRALEAVLGVPLPAPGEGATAPSPSPAPLSLARSARVAEGLWAARVDEGAEFRERAVALQEQGRTALEMLGSDALDEDELTELPGADVFALLRVLGAAHATGEWDTVVVDMPPTPRALAVLALPERARRYLRRLVPPERQAARALRPMLAQLAGVPMPAQWLYAATARWDEGLARVQRAVESAATSVRLVAEPGPLAAEALRSARAGLALHGLRIDTLVANRLLPTGSSDNWLAALSGGQQAALKEMREECEADGVVLAELPHLGHDPRGTADLALLATELGGTEPGGTGLDAKVPDATVPDATSPSRTSEAPAPVVGRVEDRLGAEGLLVWVLPLPGARKDELGLVRRGDELVVGTGPYRRVLPLPSALRRCRVTGAALERGELRVRFVPDPDLWPTR
ncbi:ArsA family ATPase [Streptomyces sp. NPDC054796]